MVRKRILSISLAVFVCVVLLFPTSTAYYWTSNPPSQGFRGNPPGGAKDCYAGSQGLDDDGSSIVSFTTGGSEQNPESIGVQPGKTLVFCVEFDIYAACSVIGGYDSTYAYVEARLYRDIGSGYNQIDLDFEDVTAYPNDANLESGYLYVYQTGLTYTAGDDFKLIVSTYYQTKVGIEETIIDSATDLAYYEIA